MTLLDLVFRCAHRLRARGRSSPQKDAEAVALSLSYGSMLRGDPPALESVEGAARSVGVTPTAPRALDAAPVPARRSPQAARRTSGAAGATRRRVKRSSAT